MTLDISSDELELLIYDKLEHLTRTRKELKNSQDRLWKLRGIVRSQESRCIYWTKEQRQAIQEESLIENLRMLERELVKGIELLYEDLRKMES